MFLVDMFCVMCVCVYVFYSVLGAFLLFSQKKLAKLQQSEHTTQENVDGRNAAVLQVIIHNQIA